MSLSTLGIFALSNIVKPLPSEVQVYGGTWRTATLWNESYWGVPEDVTHAVRTVDTDDELVYRFHTEELSPTIAVRTLSLLFDKLSFSLDSSNLDGAGISQTYRKSTLENLTKWGPRISHRSFEDVRGFYTCPCRDFDGTELRYPYFDCYPGKVTGASAVFSMDAASNLVDQGEVNRFL
jgi:hypothetical protein